MDTVQERLTVQRFPKAITSFRHGGVIALALGLTVLAGCEAPAPPTPATSLPVLERPVLALEVQTAPGPVRAPQAALVSRGGTPGVFVLQEASPFPPPARDAAGNALPRARFRMVKPGKTVQKRVEILSGLAGDEVLVLGDLKDVRDGSPIAVKR